MPVLSGYECRSCGEAWDLVWARYAVGPTGWSGQTLECGWCALQLTAPTELDGSAWQHWSREHRSAVDRYPFLRRVSERIDASLAAAGLEGRGGGYRACAIDLAAIPCPQCQRILSPDVQNRPRCPRCGALGDHRETTEIRTVRTDSPWPPIL